VTREADFYDLIRVPDSITAFAGTGDAIPLHSSGQKFSGRDVVVTLEAANNELSITIAALSTGLTQVRVRWQCKVSPTMHCLGDHWERSYGDLAWRGLTPERVMPWYFATHDESAGNDGAVHGYGVKTGAAALCFWQVDPEGISLWLDVSNGGDGVHLGARRLPAASVVTRQGIAGEAPVAALRTFCKQMCTAPRLPREAVYGANDWYCAYGKNSQEMLLRIADLLAEVAPGEGARPWVVVDMGWKEGSKAFPSMARFAEEVSKRRVRPGIWVRPLEAPTGTNEALLVSSRRFGTHSERFQELAFDPTVPEAIAVVKEKLRALVDWKFELVKHDYSTYDLLGQWGFEMGARPSIPGWHFSDRSRTNAEIIRGFYKMVRTTLGEGTQILGCNTVGHLAAGLFELQRTGDDTSGKMWERTRRMGVNTLAYRLPQHQTFFYQDADCVGITKEVPWELNRLWLDVLARTGTALFVSPGDEAIGAEQRVALKEAFSYVVSRDATAEPADYFHETSPESWRQADGTVKRYPWCDGEGAWPFQV
jgi:alpha-galactosidase